MKILVTGATGFIGSHLIRELLKNDEFEIIATSRNINNAKKFDWFKKVTFIEYDLKKKSKINLYNFFNKPDQLIHLSWGNVSKVKDLSHIEDILSDNYIFIKNMIVFGLKDVVVTGSCFEYGKIEGCLKENLNVKPVTSYAIAKDSLRKFIIELKKNFDFTYKWIRIFYVYGEGQSETSLMHLLDKAIKDKDYEFKMSGGKQLRDFLYIDDLTKYICLIARQKIYVDQVINCCSGKPIFIKDLVENYLREKKCKIKLNLGYYAYPDYEPMYFWGDRTFLNSLIKLKV